MAQNFSIEVWVLLTTFYSDLSDIGTPIHLYWKHLEIFVSF